MRPLRICLTALAVAVLLVAARPAAPGTAQGSVVVSDLQLLMVPYGDGLRVGMASTISNSGSQPYTGLSIAGASQPVTMVYTLPGNATGLRFDGSELGQRFVSVPGGFADTSAVPAGGALEARFSYDLPLQDGAVIELSYPLDVESLAVLMVSQDYRVTGDGLVDQGVMDTQMGSTRIYGASGLAAGTTLRLTVRSAAAATTASPVADALVGLAVLLVCGGVSYRLWQPATGPQPPPVAVREVVAEIARLDGQHRAGQVDASAYRQQRQALMERARAALKQG